jgi:hypothetical protein
VEYPKSYGREIGKESKSYRDAEDQKRIPTQCASTNLCDVTRDESIKDHPPKRLSDRLQPAGFRDQPISKERVPEGSAIKDEYCEYENSEEDWEESRHDSGDFVMVLTATQPGKLKIHFNFGPTQVTLDCHDTPPTIYKDGFTRYYTLQQCNDGP